MTGMREVYIIHYYFTEEYLCVHIKDGNVHGLKKFEIDGKYASNSPRSQRFKKQMYDLAYSQDDRDDCNLIICVHQLYSGKTTRRNAWVHKEYKIYDDEIM